LRKFDADFSQIWKQKKQRRMENQVYYLPLRSYAMTIAKHDKTWDRLVFEDFAVKGEWLEAAMKITGSSEIYVKDSIHALLMEGNGYTMVLMPIKNKETDKNTGEEKRMPITNFEEV
jgi:hypothetical protein